MELPARRHCKSRTDIGTFQDWIENSSISSGICLAALTAPMWLGKGALNKCVEHLHLHLNGIFMFWSSSVILFYCRSSNCVVRVQLCAIHCASEITPEILSHFHIVFRPLKLLSCGKFEFITILAAILKK